MRRDPIADQGSPLRDTHLVCAVSIAWRLCGAKVAHALVNNFGGTRLHFPSKPAPDHPISKSIGVHAATILGRECGNIQCYIPMSISNRAERRRAVVLHLIGAGKTVAQIARATVHSERAIYRDISMLRSQGAEIHPSRNRNRKRQP